MKSWKVKPVNAVGIERRCTSFTFFFFYMNECDASGATRTFIIHSCRFESPCYTGNLLLHVFMSFIYIFLKPLYVPSVSVVWQNWIRYLLWIKMKMCFSCLDFSGKPRNISNSSSCHHKSLCMNKGWKWRPGFSVSAPKIPYKPQTSAHIRADKNSVKHITI